MIGYFLPSPLALAMRAVLAPVEFAVNNTIVPAFKKFDEKYGETFYEHTIFAAITLAVSLIAIKIFGEVLAVAFCLSCFLTANKIIPYLKDKRYFEPTLKMQATLAILIPILALQSPLFFYTSPLFGVTLALSIYKKEKEVVAIAKKSQEAIDHFNNEIKEQAGKIEELKKSLKEADFKIHTFFSEFNTLLSLPENAKAHSLTLSRELISIDEKLNSMTDLLKIVLSKEAYKQRFEAKKTLDNQIFTLSSEIEKLQRSLETISDQFNATNCSLRSTANNLLDEQNKLKHLIEKLPK